VQAEKVSAVRSSLERVCASSERKSSARPASAEMSAGIAVLRTYAGAGIGLDHGFRRLPCRLDDELVARSL